MGTYDDTIPPQWPVTSRRRAANTQACVVLWESGRVLKDSLSHTTCIWSTAYDNGATSYMGDMTPLT